VNLPFREGRVKAGFYASKAFRDDVRSCKARNTVRFCVEALDFFESDIHILQKGNMKWSEEEFKEALRLHIEGEMFAGIASSLGRTVSSVKNKMSKQGISQNKRKFYERKTCRSKSCGKEFDSLISESRAYCSQSCAAHVNNIKHPKRRVVNMSEDGVKRRRKYRGKKDNECLSCGKPVIHKFCGPSCKHKLDRKNIFSQIESGTFKRDNKETEQRWVKKYLIYVHGEKCVKCGWKEVNPYSGNVPIEIEHKDGNSDNNSLENVELLCPNHHSLTPTYKGLNAGKGRHKRRKRYRDNKSY